MSAAALIQEQELQLRAQSYYPENVAHNAKQVEHVRSTALSVAGGVAGVLGMTNWLGFGFYVVSVLLTNVIVLAINANGTPSKYFITPSPPLKPLTAQTSAPTPAKNSNVKSQISTKALTIDPRSGSFSTNDVASFLINGLTENAFSFILWWTFWFGIVHVYD
ncbi:ER membrane protein complex subunit 6 [Kalmanozyma brasiliensis GHG001]|uniref:ER membrane protein complex subunit 6 n=1 Tax=Kalmanozyma brasiliensis (strain GHG001) TaxID=1365824 RepID=V5EEI5_KALBG|nr:ER membrane protein complex subunit 6 [Kalmanozyma brasiliensis GHG001]EST08911.1 ER membrane protein complex subunit 6 [Kalmanozyma brasiliensis GHG001]